MERPRVLLGLTGSVATVKWPELVLALREFAEVRVPGARQARRMRRERGLVARHSEPLSPLPRPTPSARR
jgi:hypothetical protein